MVEKECLKNLILNSSSRNSSKNNKNQLFQNLNNLSKCLQKNKKDLPPKVAEFW